jgi:hypothetical protein
MSPAKSTPADRVESRLRAEAAALRRPAPDGLLRAVMARVEGAERGAALAPGPPPRRARVLVGRLGAAGLAAAVLALVLLRSEPPAAPAPEAGPGPIARVTGFLDGARLLRRPALSGAALERPLLTELEALGQDTVRAAAALARELPGPVGDVFRR